MDAGKKKFITTEDAKHKKAGRYYCGWARITTHQE